MNSFMWYLIGGVEFLIGVLYCYWCYVGVVDCFCCMLCDVGCCVDVNYIVVWYYGDFVFYFWVDGSVSLVFYYFRYVVVVFGGGEGGGGCVCWWCVDVCYVCFCWIGW